MADFSSVKSIVSNFHSAEEILTLFKNIYMLGKKVEDILDRYNTDLAFKAEADHLFSVDQLAEIGTMITAVQNLIVDWETNHTSVIDIPLVM